MKNDSVEGLILESERSFKSAAAIQEAWSRARDQLVSNFLTRLEKSLKKILKGYRYERYGRYFDDAYPAFFIWKPSWAEGEYCVNLECWNHGQKMIFGIWRDEQEINQRPFCGAILSAVQKEFPSARAREWWEAEVTMQSPARDWRPPDVLWQMHSNPKFLTEVADLLTRVANVSDSVIEQFAAKL